MRAHRILVILTAGLMISLTACKPSEKKSIDKSVNTSSAASGLDADTYSVTLPGADKTLIIKPKAGYKVNAEFPHRAILSAGEIKETASVDHNEKRLIFKSGTDSTIPAKGVKADLSFSICNEKMCKMYKESYTW